MKHVIAKTKLKPKQSTTTKLTQTTSGQKKLGKIKLKVRVKAKPEIVAAKAQPQVASVAKPAPVVFDVNWKSGMISDKPKSAASATPEVAPTKTVYLDLFPWPFEKTRKGIVRRSEWNGLVSDIQKSCAKELESENDELQHQVKKLLDERDGLLAKYKEMSEFVAKFNREFTATYK